MLSGVVVSVVVVSAVVLSGVVETEAVLFCCRYVRCCAFLLLWSLRVVLSRVVCQWLYFLCGGLRCCSFWSCRAFWYQKHSNYLPNFVSMYKI